MLFASGITLAVIKAEESVAYSNKVVAKKDEPKGKNDFGTGRQTRKRRVKKNQSEMRVNVGRREDKWCQGMKEWSKKYYVGSKNMKLFLDGMEKRNTQDSVPSFSKIIETNDDIYTDKVYGLNHDINHISRSPISHFQNNDLLILTHAGDAFIDGDGKFLLTDRFHLFLSYMAVFNYLNPVIVVHGDVGCPKKSVLLMNDIEGYHAYCPVKDIVFNDDIPCVFWADIKAKEDDSFKVIYSKLLRGRMEKDNFFVITSPPKKSLMLEKKLLCPSISVSWNDVLSQNLTTEENKVVRKMQKWSAQLD